METISKVSQPIQTGTTRPAPAKQQSAGNIQEATGGKGRDVAEVTAAIRTERLEVIFSVQTETKEEVTTQGAVSIRAGSEGFDLEGILYNGKPLSELTPEEAQELISEGGYFGVEQTSARLSDFVIAGAGEDLGRLQAGREGIQKGFAEAEAAFGGKLPEISYQTLEKALATIDDRIRELGGSLLDVTA